jgi:hypothetical protein
VCVDADQLRSARATRSVRIGVALLEVSVALLFMLRFMLLFMVSLRRLPFWSRIGASAAIGVAGVRIVPVGAAVEPVVPVLLWVVAVVPFVPGCVVALFGSTRALSGVDSWYCGGRGWVPVATGQIGA